MRKYYKAYLALSAVVASLHMLASCGGDDGVESEVSPGRYPDSDFKKELSDASIRFIDKSHTMRYDDGGIMLTYNDGVDTDFVSLLDLETGSEIKLLWKGALHKGKLQEAVLYIDGVECRQSEIIVEQNNTKGVWINVQTPDGDRAVMVISI